MYRNKPNPLVQSKLLLIWVVFMFIMMATTLVADNATKKLSRAHSDGLEINTPNPRFESVGTFRNE